MKIQCLLVSATAVVAMAGLSASAAETKYILDEAKMATATSVTNALDWNTASNWSPATVPSGSDAFACVALKTASGVYAYITSAVPVTVRRIESATNAYVIRNVYLSEESLSLVGSGVYNGGLAIYAPLTIPDATVPFFHTIDLCGPISYGTNSHLLEDYNRIGFRFDRWANSTDAVRTNPYGSAGELRTSGGTLVFYSPESSATAVTGSYRLTDGSPYAFRASGVRHTLSVGTVVTCPGALPDGTYLKRVFPDDTIELSQAATNTLAAASLEFAAFTPSVSLTLPKIHIWNASSVRIILNKTRAEDELVISTPNFYWPKGHGKITVMTEDGYKPGVLSTCGFKASDSESDENATLTLNTCEIEITPPSDGAACDEYAKIYQESGYTSGLAVPAGKTVSVKHVKEWAGTLVKRGAGTLAVNFDCTSYGTLEVAAGRCAPTFSEDAPVLPSLVLRSGAELVVPASGLSVLAVTLEAGAIVSGGTLTVSGATNPADPGVVCKDGAKIVYSYAPGSGTILYDYDASWTTLPSRLSTAAAFWVDANRADSLTTETVDSVTYVTRVNDVRGEGYNFATNVVYKPVLRTMSGGNRMINFRGNVSGISGDTTDINRIDTLVWDKPVYGIRFVFQALDRGRNQWNTLGSGGQYLGTTARMSSYIGCFLRPAGFLWYQYIFHSPKTGLGTFRMLDEVYPAYRENTNARGLAYVTDSNTLLDATLYPDSYLYAPSITSLETVQFQVTSALRDYPAADSFDYDVQAVNRFGVKGLCELIVFTNEVSVSDRQAITAYLAKKWNNCELATFGPTDGNGKMFGSAAVDGDLNISVAADNALVLTNATGSGTLAKEGAGTLYLGDYANAEGKIHVKGGTLEIAAPTVTEADLPEGAFIHLDATDLSSMTYVVEEGKTNLTVWADKRGSAYPKATLVNTKSTQKPYIRNNALNGHPVIDFGAYHYDASSSSATANSPHMALPKTNYLHSVFAIWGSRNGGGTGIVGEGYGRYNTGEGLVRGGTDSYGSKLSDPILRSSQYPAFGGNYSYGYRFRLNGERKDPTVATFSGNFDLVSLVSCAGFGMSALSSAHYSHYWGGEEIGEYIVYERALSDANALKVEAYLRKKWYGEDTPGCRAPAAGEVTVDAGATLKLRGAAPITVSSLNCAGSVDGSVVCTASAVLEVTVNDDGSVTPIALTGTLDLSAGATIRLVGATGKLQTGSWPVVTTTGITSGALSLEADGVRKSRKLALAAEGNSLVLTVTRCGVAVFVR